MNLQDNQPPQNRMMRKAEMAKQCAVSTRTIENWVKQRRIPVWKIGRTVLFNPDEVLHALSTYRITSKGGL